MYRDKLHADVTFKFSSSTDPLLAQGSDHDEGHVTGMDVDQLKLATAKHSVKEFSQSSVINAHKLVLCQWPYFKAMFEGGFAESSPGTKRIQIKDCKAQAFRLLVYFMYTGKLPKDTDLEVYADALVDQEDASWEDICIVAHMYDVQELHEQAAETIVEGMDPQHAISFLFRTGYKYPQLRRLVIEFVAEHCVSPTTMSDIRSSYKDHPDVRDILGEIFEAHLRFHMTCVKV
ncbi:hypothetical protein BGZ81_004964 [Podila clonocystis]|nr:hypothetical protein BGZ81_004964 [Podila clonocystis]